MLLCIIEKFSGGPVGLTPCSINEEAGTIEDVYEPYLLQLGLLINSQRRIVTQRAYEHLKIHTQNR